MKYQCDNCQYCCISSSPQISYCGLTSQCSQEQLSKSLLIGISVLSTILFAAFLYALYYFLRNREFATHLQNNIKIQSDVISPQQQPKSKRENNSKKQGEKTSKKKDKSKDKARKNNKSKSTKSKPSKSSYPETQRGLV